MSHGIIHKRSCPQTPQQNGVAERKLRHLLETSRAIKFQGHLPNRFWGECIEAATYIINRIPLPILNNKSPFEVLYNKQPSLSHLRVIGCLGFVTSIQKGYNFEPKAKKVILLGYAASQKGYKMLNIESRRLFVSRDVIFYEEEFPFQTSEIGQENDPEIALSYSTMGNYELTPCVVIKNATNDFESVHHQNPVAAIPDLAANLDSDSKSVIIVTTSQEQAPSTLPTPDVVTVRRSNRPVKPPLCHTNYVLPKNRVAGQCLYPIADVVDYCSITPSYRSSVTKFSQERKPTSYHEAVHDPRWIDAMKHEIQALEDNHTWVITQLSKDKRAIGCKWVYKIKYKADGKVDRFKARFVAKGYNQKEGLEYQDTFSQLLKWLL